MAIKWFHGRSADKRRGDNLPARLRFAARRGTTLVELLIAMLILTIVCIAWLEIIGIQSARKEARRREAVERLAGMMDAFMYMNKSYVVGGNYHLELNENINRIQFKRDDDAKIVHAVFDQEISPIGYQLSVVEKEDLENMESFVGWWDYEWDAPKWLIGRLYDRSGTLDDVPKPFFTLQVYLEIL